ncbi:hypothetical protein EB796_025248 [Bugula neritina]|uniref:Uncharacterized protein n=1 Tax=Bugula neritina TaxID=10212 RepID=A0A7J7IRI7_BUGNE|nr:hypothetical protein EB796_025248 [Bugula neritina]
MYFGIPFLTVICMQLSMLSVGVLRWFYHECTNIFSLSLLYVDMEVFNEPISVCYKNARFQSLAVLLLQWY